MCGTLASVAGLAGFMETVEEDDGVFVDLDRSLKRPKILVNIFWEMSSMAARGIGPRPLIR
jgi:hypothetical protein